MKKLIALFVLALLIPSPAYASQVKAGTTCKKAGQVVVQNQMKFTCIKSGKKLIWSKGVRISVATTSPSVTATPSPTPSATPSPASSLSQSNPPAKGSWSKSEIAEHGKQSDCWSYLGEKVYNLTPWISEHPGGSEIMLEMCGNDGTQSFRSHHQNEVDAYLAQYLIGTLTKA